MENWSSKAKQKVYLKGMASAMKIKWDTPNTKNAIDNFFPMVFWLMPWIAGFKLVWEFQNVDIFWLKII